MLKKIKSISHEELMAEPKFSLLYSQMDQVTECATVPWAVIQETER